MEPVHVLFVDDDDSLQLLASALLNGNLFEIFSAHNVKEAENLLEKRRIDLIVCDVLMPGEDGISFCTRLKTQGCKIPILILSACDDPTTMKKGISSGINQYLVKPFDIYELQSRMLRMVGRKMVRPPTAKGPGDPPKFLNWFRR